MFLKDYFKMKKVNDSRLMQALGACHSLTRINNEICGDPLEIEMFNATKWSLVEPDVPEEENLDTFEMTYVEDPEKTVKIYQIRQFAFSSDYLIKKASLSQIRIILPKKRHFAKKALINVIIKLCHFKHHSL